MQLKNKKVIIIISSNANRFAVLIKFPETVL